MLIGSFAISNVAAQCDELFISGYVEGYGNNRALEIYNPTQSTVDLSQYSVGRFSNGSTSLTAVQLPADMLQPYETYVVVLDKRDPNGIGLETPVWNGYEGYEPCIDELTGLPEIVDNDTLYCVQYDTTGVVLYGDVYHEELDLQGKANAFLCPVYDINNAMYFNGNDAVALIKGTTLASDGSNLLDAIGIIGDDPGDTWATPDGEWLTKDRTLKRKNTVKKGSYAIAALGQTFTGDEWDIYDKNTFIVLGSHTCDCNEVGLNYVAINGLEMYPNPLSQRAVLHINSPQTPVQAVNIYAYNGQLVMQQNGQQQMQLSIDTQNLVSGVYMVEIIGEKQEKSYQKLVIE